MSHLALRSTETLAAIRSERGEGGTLADEEDQKLYAGDKVVQCAYDHSVLDKFN